MVDNSTSAPGAINLWRLAGLLGLPLLILACASLGGCGRFAAAANGAPGFPVAEGRSVSFIQTGDAPPLPLGLDEASLAEPLAKAGFPLAKAGDRARYWVQIAVSAADARIGSFVPVMPASAAPPSWLARPARGMRTIIAPGTVLRVTLVFTDLARGGEAYRFTASGRAGRDPVATTLALVRFMLAEIPAPPGRRRIPAKLLRASVR